MTTVMQSTHQPILQAATINTVEGEGYAAIECAAGRSYCMGIFHCPQLQGMRLMMEETVTYTGIVYDGEATRHLVFPVVLTHARTDRKTGTVIYFTATIDPIA